MVNESITPSLYEGINARYYGGSELARHFVPNEPFDALIVRQHSLLVGPRGSGKTTLLRMLHAECLEQWDHSRADYYRAAMDFTGIYVATDRAWRLQTDSLSESCAHESDRELLRLAVFSTDLLRAFVEALRFRVEGRHRKIESDGATIASLVDELSDFWGLTPKFLDLSSLWLGFRERRREIKRHADQCKANGGSHSWPAWMRTSWQELLLFGIDAVQVRLKLPEERWALLIDELEIAPQALRDAILSATRGMDRRVLIKCCLSPYIHKTSFWLDHDEGVPYHDFTLIRLSYGQRSESYSFSRAIIKSRLESTGRILPPDKPVEDLVFGTSEFLPDGAPSKSRRTSAAYGSNTPLGLIVQALAESDPHFRNWLQSNKISPQDLEAVSEKRRAQTLRKARNIMIARLEFRRAKGLLRSRKTLAMYSGGTTMLNISEGNPRLILGILVPLLEYFDGVHPVPARIQSEVLSRVSADFLALIDTIPTSQNTLPQEFGPALKPISPYRLLINKIARYFQDSMLRGAFDPQPASTFRVPAACSEGLKEVVGRLVNVGAFVLMPDRGPKDIVVHMFDQQRVRLSYLVAANKHLPPNVDRPVSLLTILGHAESDTDYLPGLDPY